MSVSILEALAGADYNLQHNGLLGLQIAKAQVHNATILLEKGYSIHEEIESLLEKYGTVEDVPEKEE